MSLPKDPRQKMINMMYLVLIAMLALNVSAEILNAFKTVNNSLLASIKIIDNKNDEAIKAIIKKAEDPTSKEKASYWLPIAEKAKNSADEVFKYIDELKEELKKESGLEIKDGKEVYKYDDLDAPTRMFVESDESGKKLGPVLKKKLLDFRSNLLNLDPKIKKEFETALPIEVNDQVSDVDPGKILPWDYAYFHMTPSIAALTLLTKLQSDVRSSEEEIISFCLRQIGQVEIIYDEFNAFSSVSSQYVLPGDNITISAGVGAFNKDAKPNIYIDGVLVNVKANGVAEYSFQANEPGDYSKKVKIYFVKPDGTKSEIDKIINYTVGQPSGLVVSTDATRVFYKGLDNPLSIRGEGGDEGIKADVIAGNAVLSKAGKGKYIVKCNSLGHVNLRVFDGKTKQEVTIPVKRVPDPIPSCNGSSGGTMQANIFKIQKGITVDLKDFVFEGISFPIQKFTVVFQGKGFEELDFQENEGPYFNGKVKELLKRCQDGSTITIGDIYVGEPGGGNRKLEQYMTFILE